MESWVFLLLSQHSPSSVFGSRTSDGPSRRTFAELGVSRVAKKRVHVLSNELCEPLLFGSFGPPIDPKRGKQIAQLSLRHTNCSRISGWYHGLLGNSRGMSL